MRMMALLLALLVPLLSSPRPLAAQETMLKLAASAEVTRPPDELRATLRVEAGADTAAAAQAAVNRAAAAAIERARRVPTVTATTGSYWTYRVANASATRAAQTISLVGTDPAALLDLVGALQGSGLALNGLDYALTRATQRSAADAASALAIERLQAQAATVAAQLGMQVVALREMRIGVQEPAGPRPMAMAARRSDSVAAAPPVAEPGDVVVNARVEADFVLRPR